MYGHYAATPRRFTKLCDDCGGSGIEFIDGGEGNVIEDKCSTCAGMGHVPIRSHTDPIQLIAAGIFLVICLVGAGVYFAVKAIMGA